MAVTKASNSSIASGPKYISFLAGNTAFDPSAYDQIAFVTAAGGEKTLTFSSIPQTFASLQLRVLGRSTNASNDDLAFVRFNGSSAGYAWHLLYGDGASVSASGASSSSSGSWAVYVPANNYNASMFGVSIIDLHDYSSTTRNTTARIFTGMNTNGGASQVMLNSALWNNAAAVTSVSLTMTTGNFAAGSAVALYGLAG
jgi:hypothetical protein